MYLLLSGGCFPLSVRGFTRSFRLLKLVPSRSSPEGEFRVIEPVCGRSSNPDGRPPQDELVEVTVLRVMVGEVSEAETRVCRGKEPIGTETVSLRSWDFDGGSTITTVDLGVPFQSGEKTFGGSSDE